MPGKYTFLKMGSLLMGLMLFCACHSKKEAASFESQAADLNGRFVALYQKRDTLAYEQQLGQFLELYARQPEKSQKNYVGYLANVYYNLSCTYSLVGNKQKAIASLGKAIQYGYFDYAHIQSDKDLDPIRQEATYQQLVASIRKVGDFPYILKRANQYNEKDQRPLPAFTYASPENTHLRNLRETARLDSIAGNGDETSRIIRLMHWVHTLIPHDGNHGNPEIKNALSMMKVCKQDKRGLNCRGLATVLNECYLAMGYPSRFVTCMPKDSLKTDPDCHVINMVYSKSLQKWIWMDPTNDAYVMDENNHLLGIEEVRDRIIRDLPLHINEDANWNHKEPVKASDYLYRYMAKNLYRLETPVASVYDCETREPGKTVRYIQLLPLDYFEQSPDSSKYGNNLIYRTNNPITFWKLPG
ncbi:MAG: transglutaminase-like domain-containing protein [Marinilabiliales bacterium]|nr:transglutaminase-like domain-containing protein [Marinilabiliales bacterium]